MKYILLSKILNQKNGLYAVIGAISNGNLIVLNNNRLEIISGKTNKFLGYSNIKQLIKYDNMIKYYVNNVFLYYLSEIEAINKHNGAIEENNGY